MLFVLVNFKFRMSQNLKLQPLVFEVRKEMFIKKYSVLIGNQHLIKPNQVFGVSQLKHLCRWVLMTINLNLFLDCLQCYYMNNN